MSLPAGHRSRPGEARGGWNEADGRGLDLHQLHRADPARRVRPGRDPGRGREPPRQPNGPVIGRVREGTLLERVGAEGQLDPGPPEGLDSPEGHRAAVRQPAAAAGELRRDSGSHSSRRPAEAPRPPRARRPRRPRAPPQPAEAVERVQTARETPLGAAPEGGTLGTCRQAPGPGARAARASGSRSRSRAGFRPTRRAERQRARWSA